MVWPSIQVPRQAPAYGTQAVTSRDVGTETPRQPERKLDGNCLWGLFPEPQLDLAQPTDFLRPESPHLQNMRLTSDSCFEELKISNIRAISTCRGGALQGRTEPFLALNISLITCLRAWPSDHLIHVLDKGFIFKNAAARIFLRL